MKAGIVSQVGSSQFSGAHAGHQRAADHSETLPRGGNPLWGLCYTADAGKGEAMQIFEKLKPLALLLLRLGVGGVFVSQGYLKLFVAPAKWLTWFPQHGFPSYFAYLAGGIEFFGGILLILGLVTRVVGLIFAVEMGIAVWRVSLPHSGIHNVDGYGFPLMLGLASFTLAAVGAGLLSVDAATFERGGGSRPKKRA
jgi:putative oxidoreductase